MGVAYSETKNLDKAKEIFEKVLLLKKKLYGGEENI